MVNLIIDHKPVTVADGTTILEAAREINIRIPSLCYLDLGELKMVNKVASCRICSVEVEGRRNLAPACATPVAEGMKVTTNSKRVLFARRRLLELMLSNHPFNCLICAKSTDCELQTLAWEFGINTQRYHGEMSSFPVDKSSKALKRDPEKCIMCRRCETMCNEVQTVHALTAYGRGFNAIVAPAEMKPLAESNCTFCGQCVSVCPTAALTGHGYIQETWAALFDPTKTVVVEVAPAIRAAIGEEFGIPIGTPVTGKLVAGLRRLGFHAVFDTTFGADLTVVEEAKEIINRVTRNENLPILTSCCPGWINFLKYQFPSLKYMPSSSLPRRHQAPARDPDQHHVGQRDAGRPGGAARAFLRHHGHCPVRPGANGPEPGAQHHEVLLGRIRGARVRQARCPAGVCQALLCYEIIPEKCVGCTACARGCPVHCISGTVKQPHVIDQSRCIKCGACMAKCKFKAILRH